VRAAGAVALAAFSVAFGVAVNGSRAPGAGAAAATHGSYCQAALAVAQYGGHDRAHLDALIGRALARSQGARGSVKSLRLMRGAPPTTHAYAVALRSFTQFNTDHCCECHASSEPPQLMSGPPDRGRLTPHAPRG
jgi:hypothetical protein